MSYLLRQKRLAEDLRWAHMEALLVTHLPNIYYLCGFTGSAGIQIFRSILARYPLLSYAISRNSPDATRCLQLVEADVELHDVRT